MGWNLGAPGACELSALILIAQILHGVVGSPRGHYPDARGACELLAARSLLAACTA